jgi:hypothetical protein
MKYEYDMGYLGPEDRKFYEDNYLNKEKIDALSKLTESKLNDSDTLTEDSLSESSDSDE